MTGQPFGGLFIRNTEWPPRLHGTLLTPVDPQLAAILEKAVEDRTAEDWKAYALWLEDEGGLLAKKVDRKRQQLRAAEAKVRTLSIRLSRKPRQKTPVQPVSLLPLGASADIRRNRGRSAGRREERLRDLAAILFEFQEGKGREGFVDAEVIDEFYRRKGMTRRTGRKPSAKRLRNDLAKMRSDYPEEFKRRPEK